MNNFKKGDMVLYRIYWEPDPDEAIKPKLGIIVDFELDEYSRKTYCTMLHLDGKLHYFIEEEAVYKLI